jgi:hypothetical protein
MTYDGVVIRIEELYLFILDPDTNEVQDGINISEHDCYKDLKNNQLMVVKVTFKDGTQEIDKIDLDEFIHGEKYGKYDTFLHIQDITLFSIGHKGFKDKNVKNVSLENIIQKGELTNIAIECIELTKNPPQENQEENE